MSLAPLLTSSTRGEEVNEMTEAGDDVAVEAPLRAEKRNDDAVGHHAST